MGGPFFKVVSVSPDAPSYFRDEGPFFFVSCGLRSLRAFLRTGYRGAPFFEERKAKKEQMGTRFISLAEGRGFFKDHGDEY